MADKSFGVRQLNLIGTGTPTIESTGNINLDANKVAISTDVTVGRNLNVSGIITATDGFNIGISSSGTTIATGSVKSLNFVGSGNTFFYNTSTQTVDITIQGGSDVTQGTYGDARFVPQITVNADGAISDISEVEIFSNGLGNDLNINSNDITGTGNINITGNITASGTGNKFFGDGSGLTGIVAQGSGITLKLNGTTVGLAQTVDFVGAGVTAIENVEGTATVYLPTANRTLSRIIATDGQTSITGLSYTIGAVDVYLNGGRLDTTEFTATNGTSITLTTGASVNDIIEVVAHQITSSAPSSSTITQEESIAFAIALG